jgi:hypothetical protein
MAGSVGYLPSLSHLTKGECDAFAAYFNNSIFFSSELRLATNLLFGHSVVSRVFFRVAVVLRQLFQHMPLHLFQHHHR